MPAAFEVPSLRSLARHAAPHLLEATLIPMVLFYAAMALAGVWAALAAGLLWSYGAVLRRVVTRQRIPGVLVLGALAMTVRTVLSVASGSVLVYFLQPTLGTVAMAGLFIGSVLTGRPLTARLANDFVPLPDTLLSQPWVRRFFARLSVAWGVAQLLSAGITLWLLLTQPLTTYIAAKTVVSWTLSGSVIVVATLVFRRNLAASAGRSHPLPLPAGPVPAVPALAMAA